MKKEICLVDNAEAQQGCLSIGGIAQVQSSHEPEDPNAINLVQSHAVCSIALGM